MENHNGKVCSFCNAEFKEGDNIKTCDVCGISHHQECWDKNKGCSTFGCSQQHIEPQGANASYVCICGTTLGADQAFCGKCGTPKKVINLSTCGKCGTQLAQGQEFCHECGQKAGLTAVDTKLTHTINSLNGNLGKKKSRKKLVVFLTSVIALLIISGIFLFAFWDTILPFSGGEYAYVGGEDTRTYTFTDGRYTYKTTDDTVTGTYTFEKGEAILTDSEGSKSTFIRKGDYLFENETLFKDKIPSGNKFEKTLNYSDSSPFLSTTLYTEIKVHFSSDGTYTWDYKLSTSGDYESNINQTGTYKRSSSTIVLKPKGETYMRTIIIHNNQIYINVYKKK